MLNVLIPVGSERHLPYLMSSVAALLSASVPYDTDQLAIRVMANYAFSKQHPLLAKTLSCLAADYNCQLQVMEHGEHFSLAQIRLINYRALYGQGVTRLLVMDCDVIWNPVDFAFFTRHAPVMLDQGCVGVRFSFKDVFNAREYPDYQATALPIASYLSLTPRERDKAGFHWWQPGTNQTSSLLVASADPDAVFGYFDYGKFNMTNGMIDLGRFVNNTSLMAAWSNFPKGLRGHDIIMAEHFPNWRKEFCLLFGANASHIGILDPVIDGKLWQQLAIGEED